MNIKLWAITATAACIAAAAPAIAQGRQNFTLINKTGYTIEQVYVSASKADDWEEDVLGDGTLEDGTKTEIQFANSAGGCTWDLKVVYDDKTSAVWKNFDLCTISQIAISYNAKTGVTSAKWE